MSSWEYKCTNGYAYATKLSAAIALMGDSLLRFEFIETDEDVIVIRNGTPDIEDYLKENASQIHKMVG